MRDLLFLFVACTCPFGEYIVNFLQLYPKVLEGLFFIMWGFMGYILIFYIPDKFFGGEE